MPDDLFTRHSTALATSYRLERPLGPDRFVVEIRATASLQHPHSLPN